MTREKWQASNQSWIKQSLFASRKKFISFLFFCVLYVLYTSERPVSNEKHFEYYITDGIVRLWKRKLREMYLTVACAVNIARADEIWKHRFYGK